MEVLVCGPPAGRNHARYYLWTCWNSHGFIICILQLRKLRLREVEKLPKALSLAGARLSQYLLSMEQGE